MHLKQTIPQCYSPAYTDPTNTIFDSGLLCPGPHNAKFMKLLQLDTLSSVGEIRG